MAAEAEGGRTLPTQHISMQMSTSPRDLLQKFISSGNHFPRKYEEVSEEDNNTEEEEIELSLGLSLNGRFGFDPIRANKLTRSSSIPDFMNQAAAARDGDETLCMLPLNMMRAAAPLTRTCSLPVETEEQWRKRKELQSLRRMEAKRKRTEKQRNIIIRVARERERDRGNFEENYEEDKRVEDKSVLPINGNEQYNKVLCLNGRGRGFCALGIESKGERGNGLVGGAGGGGLEGLAPPPPLPPSSQGSIASQGSGSSGISEFECQTVQGMNKCVEVRSPANMQSLPEQGERNPAVTLGTAVEDQGKFSGVVMENPSRKLSVGDKGAKEMMRNVMAEMPCVSTKGDGPNGKRIEGFLYRYRKGEEVRIVCVCHGSFLSPAEFVKHAGGGDVAHPLKHIVVNPYPFL